MERALLVTVDIGRGREWTAEERQAELGELARSAGAKVVKQVIARRQEPQPASYIGKGKAEELAVMAASDRIDIIIFNNDLTGTQQKNLEEVVKAKVIDRTQLILDIFAKRAHSNEGKIQVELAQLMYMLPRLIGEGVKLSRLGGGIGTRGPGEQKLEVDRRRIRARIARLKDELDDMSVRRAMMRKKRERFSALTIALVGYTNVGKSTLLNALTSSEVIVQDKLFSTLDPTVRRFILPNKQKVLFVDTVGFLNDLPHHLIEAFKATLEEVSCADLLLHVVDASHPKAGEQARSVYGVLDQIGAKEKPVITVLNKVDLLPDEGVIDRMASKFDSPVKVSALKRYGFNDLISRILGRARELTVAIDIVVPASDNDIIGLIHDNGLVTKREYSGNSVHLAAEVPLRLKEYLLKRLDI